MNSICREAKYIAGMVVQQHIHTSDIVHGDEEPDKSASIQLLVYPTRGGGLSLCLPYMNSSEMREFAEFILRTASIQEALEKKNDVLVGPVDTLPGC